jgi:hypothetical protein
MEKGNNGKELELLVKKTYFTVHNEEYMLN